MPLQIRFEPIHRANARYPENVMDLIEKNFEEVLFGPIQAVLVGAMVLRTLGWAQSPSFRSKFSRRASHLGLTGFSLTVAPSGQPGTRLWGYVSLGVKARRIVPRRKRYLWIEGGVGGYAPHTTAGGAYAGPGAYAPAGFRARAVDWPGIKARAFEKNIRDQHEKEIVGLLAGAWERSLSGG